MNMFLMIFRAPRPSRTDDMKAVAKPRWIRKGYDGLTLFGTIITHLTMGMRGGMEHTGAGIGYVSDDGDEL